MAANFDDLEKGSGLIRLPVPVRLYVLIRQHFHVDMDFEADSKPPASSPDISKEAWVCEDT